MGIPLRTLIIEDSEDDVLLLVRILQRGGYDPVYRRVETADAMDEALERETWDIILSDYNMPHFNGHAALALFKEKELDIPFIIVSGAIGEEAAVATIISGAHDYVMKNNLLRLVPSVRRELKEAQSRRENKLFEAERLLNEILHEVLLNLYKMLDASQTTITAFIVEECLKISESAIAFIGFINEDDTIIDAHLWTKKIMEKPSVEEKPVRSPLEEAGLWGEVIRQKRPVLVNNYSDINPYTKGCRESHIPLIRFMGVPLIDNNRVVLVAGVANKKAPYTQSDILHTSLLLEGMWNFIQRKKAEENLRLSEQKYRDIFENVVEGIFQTTPEGRFLIANNVQTHILGYSSPEELIETVTDIGMQIYANPADRKEYLRMMQKAGSVKGFEVQLIKKDSSIIWASLNARSVFDENNKLLCFEGTVEDITSRKEAEIALQRSRDELAVIIEGSAIPQFVINKNHVVILWNKALEIYSGMDAKDVLGTSNHWKAFYPEKRPCLVDCSC